ncbi:MAG: hypothetical protein R3313_05360, partial [Candidatus Saccharimonadales bacterium]|nr:hypothetical protein [Candidatus Saccharimonadales bacterium]
MNKRIATTFAALLMLPVGFFSVVFAHMGDDNLIPNHSAEVINDQSSPDGWTYNHWGEISAAGEITSDASDGSIAMHVSVADRTSGDAKWYFDPVAIEADTGYDFSNSYKATTQSEVVVQYTLADGSLSYQWLGSNPAVNDWSPAYYSFT